MHEYDTWILLVVAVMNATTLYYSHKTEKNTNSMKDALVARTAEAEFRKGQDAMRVDKDAEAATLAKGQLAEKKGK